MVKKTIQVGPSFESKVVAELVQKASQFKSHLSLVMEEKTANAKSIMGIISINLHADNLVTIVANGPDENEAVMELTRIIGA
ncbi:MAG: HPr family phosphocarrier protein [Defluviitaleaceae bacterium]|nr:HPr family phosphocarrier protein [Defluviitaleaceae bacterium]